MGRKRVVILGAGVAGLTAAHELLERGFDVVIVDRRAEAGGKARSYRTSSWVPGQTVEQHRILPGEHGFRFFPGFYRHLDATMRKIPLVPGDDKAGSVIDNLVPIREELLAVSGKPAIIVPAAAPGGPSLVDAFRSILQFPKDLLNVGLSREDLELFANKLWQFATSSPARRNVEYEGLGWRQFIESLDRSDEYYWYLASGLTRVLVAAKGRKASTKTIGNVGMQLLLCMTERNNTTDRVLNGPTNDVWFEPWVKYLGYLAKQKGVQFDYLHSTSVEEIRVAGRKVRSIKLAGTSAREVTDFDQVICALPVEAFAMLIKQNGALRKAGGKQFRGIAVLGDRSEKYLERMTGMQIYLKRDVRFNPGHQIFPDSPWGLTSISQRQFWNPKRVGEWLPDKMGVLSIDISSWDLEGVDDIPAAQDCTVPGIFRGTVKQLRRALGDKGLSDENIAGWHLDGVTGGKLSPDLEPILVNHVGSAAMRPTSTTGIANLFLAGDYVRTRTDLACMEGANESARGAVNCLLDAVNYEKSDRCEMFDPLDREPRPLKLLQQMDDYRFKRGLPWGGVSLGDWMVRAGWAADAVGDVLLADDKGDTSTIPLGPAADALTDVLPSQAVQPYRRPRAQWVKDLTYKKPSAKDKAAEDQLRCKQAVANAVALAKPVSNDVLPKAFAAPGRVDPMFLRWPLHKIHVDFEDKPDDYIIPFIVYDADAVIVHGQAMNFEFLQSWTAGTGGEYHPVYCRQDGKKVGYAELWLVRYNDTVGGPYDEIVINFVVSRRPDHEYRWRTPYSSLVPMMDPQNRLFTIRLLVDERADHTPPNQGPIKFGNELFGTDKRKEQIHFVHEKDRRRISIVESKVETLRMDVDFAESAVRDVTDYIGLTREIGVLEAMRMARQGWRGDVLGGGLITPDFRLERGKNGMPPSTIEILASYKFNPKLSVSAAKGLWYRRSKVPKDSFASLLNAMGFVPKIAALDPHLKSVLYLDDWPTAGRPSADAKPPKVEHPATEDTVRSSPPADASTPSWTADRRPALGRKVHVASAARRGRPRSSAPRDS